MTQKKPLINIVITNHNYGSFIRHCVESLNLQTLPRNQYTITIVDDASTDNSKAVLHNLLNEKLIDEFFQVDFRDPNKTRNFGAQNCGVKAKYIHFFDSDDFATPQLLRAILKGITPDYDVSYCLAEKASGGPVLFQLPTRENLIRSSGIHMGTALITRKMYDKINGFTEGIECLDDYDLWLKISNANGRFAMVPDRYFVYRDNKEKSRGKLNQDPSHRQQAYAKLHKKHATVTLFTPFNGKDYCLDQYLKAVDQIKGLSKIVFYDNSNSKKFNEKLKAFAKTKGNITIHVDKTPHLIVPANHTTKKQRIEIGQRTTDIYQYMADTLDTDYVLIVEDDVIVPPTIVDALMNSVFVNVGQVSATVTDRRIGTYMVWKFILAPGEGSTQPEDVWGMDHADVMETGRDQVGAASLACSLVPKWSLDYIGTLRFDVPGGIHYGTDVRFGYDLAQRGLGVIVDWDITPPHLSPPKKKKYD